MNDENKFQNLSGDIKTSVYIHPTYEYKKIIMSELLRAGVRDIDHIVKFSKNLSEKMVKGDS